LAVIAGVLAFRFHRGMIEVVAVPEHVLSSRR